MSTEIRFYLANGLTPESVKNANYVIYAHKCLRGLYIGYTEDPVRRWKEHERSALQKDDRNYKNAFKEAIRAFPQGFKHYILATASNETCAKKKESSAIKFYKPELNTKADYIASERDYDFRELESGILLSCVFKQKRKVQENNSRSDRDRVTVDAIVYKQGDRKRLKTIRAEPFKRVMNIACNKSALDNVEAGTVVQVKVSETAERAQKGYLRAANSTFIRVGRK